MSLENRKSKAPLVLCVLSAVVLLASFGLLPISVAAIGGVAVLLVTKCIKPSEAYRSVEWNILVLIYGMLALGVTLKKNTSIFHHSFIGRKGVITNF